MKPTYNTYHYGDQGFNDYGWGCSYRNAQTVASALGHEVPTMEDLLGVYGLDRRKLAARKLWIEPPQVAFMLERLRGIRGSLAVYASESLRQFEKGMLRTKVTDFPHTIEADPEGLLSFLDKHFVSSGGLPVIIDDAVYSYLLLPHPRDRWYTLVDPHVKKKYSVRVMRSEELVSSRGWMMYLPEK